MKNKQRFLAAICLLVMPLVYPGEAWADRLKPYLTDGTKEVGANYSNPGDGVCVVGLKLDGTLDVNTLIDNYKDCVVYTNATIRTNATQAACLGGTGNTDGFKHAWSASICVDGSGNPISRVDLDNTVGMCSSKGGTVISTGVCVAYGWVYMNSKAGEAIPYRSTVSPAGYKGRTAADNLGFCYTSMRMTSVPYDIASCPSQNNIGLTCAGGANLGKVCTVANQAVDCPASTCGPNTGWAYGTDGVSYQSQTSYDAGLGWSWNATAPAQCLYAYGTKGYVNAALTKADNTQVAAGTYVDLTAFTTQGDCLANGGSWDNWLPTLGGTAPGATAVAVATAPSPSTIMKLDPLTALASGGGQFYSGTGAVCQKCHADQSRSYAERTKPGFPETGHKLAGDTDPARWDPSPQWGLKGVQCEVCHATGKPTQQDVGVVVYPNRTGTNAGLPRAASGHNQTEYGSHVTGVCYNCHGTPTVPATGNPAAVIPVASGDFAPTAKGLAPIANQFLNSPHAKYTGTSATVEVVSSRDGAGAKVNYGSTFVGYICRSTNAVGGGSILTTVYQNGVAGRIPNLDTLTNPDCTNVGDGSATSGAATSPGVGAFWVKEGEAASTANGVAYGASDQGNCMTCHDVHWALNSTAPGAEPLRRECTTCHSHPASEASVTSAPQSDLNTINHLGGAGTPLANAATDPNSACESCHMPKSNVAAGTGAPMHLWRISSSATYTTMGATKANTAADGTYADAAWVDVDHACGQCHSHGGSAPQYTTAQLAAVAKGMHSAAATTYAVTFTAVVTGVHVAVDATVDCGGTCPTLTYDWSWGDGTANGTGDPAAHDYATAGAKTITLTVSLAGKTVGTVTRTVTMAGADLAPTAAATCTWNANTWAMTSVDASTDDGPDADSLPGDGNAALQIVVDWGDGTTKTITTQGSTSTHTYARVGTFAVKNRANDAKLQTSLAACTGGTATPAYFTIAGTIKKSNNSAAASVTVKIKRGATLVKTLTTSATGTFTTGATLPPGAYTITATKTGYTFAVPAWSGSIGPSATAVTVNSTTP
jgi:hypothetical protein